MKQEKYKKYIFIIIGFISIILLLSFLDLKAILRNSSLNIFRENIFYIINLAGKFKTIIILAIIFFIYYIVKNRWVFRIEKMSYGGITIICNKPDKILKQSIKNFLNTKRTLFYINPKKDNFYDTINSYYLTYNFIKSEMSTYDIDSLNNDLYNSTNQMIQVLNEFLTNNQSDYRRWYEYLIENKKESIYDKDIYDIQKDYRKYDNMLTDFAIVNEKFIELGKKFDINMDKWNKNKGN